MPLNKLDNFIKNTEGRILYVNPSDLDSTDSITNEGNSLAKPFKTVQRALIEAARFSYLSGNNNDITEKTTILLFPGEHIIDNRPGYAIYDNNNTAYVTPVDGGVGDPASTQLSLELDTNFDLTQNENILYKFNSVNGGVIVPRGTSIVGLDLRKTKIRPKYVPNPTDPSAPNTAIFRITGACYFWQFSIFDGNDKETVYTNPRSFTEEYRSIPRFSHHKLTVFEYADGVNVVNRVKFGDLTDLDMYYHKVGNAYNVYRDIENISKFPRSKTSFAKRAPEWEIVGSFKSDPIDIARIISGNGTTASDTITVTTSTPHNLNANTPILVTGVKVPEYNISTFVLDIIDDYNFTYRLESFKINLDASPRYDGAKVTVETDTVNGASPYVFNISLRSVWGMNGMHADGSKASGFRSMVVAQFTAVSLQKDDRAFTKYNTSKRKYDVLTYNLVHGADLPAQASDSVTPYHIDQDAIYRPGWESSHIKVSNDAFIQIVSVFAIGFTYHFDMNSGADASITNSNSNFGQVALKSTGFKPEAFEKDDHAYITSIVAPRSIDASISDNIDWLQLDVPKTRDVANSKRLYLSGFTSRTAKPTALVQGYRVGGKQDDVLYLEQSSNGTAYTFTAPIFMTGQNNELNRNEKSYSVNSIQYDNHFNIGTNNLQTGERVIINSETGDLPEGINEHTVYYAITAATDPYNQNTNPDGLRNSDVIKLASSYTFAFLGEAVDSFGGVELTIKSRVSDKDAGDIGSPLQFDESNGQWYINVGTNNAIYNSFLDSGIGYDNSDDDKYSDATDLAYVTRVADERALDEKTYKIRVVIPKESSNAKNPEIGFILQDSSSVSAEALNSDENENFSANIAGHPNSRTTLPVSQPSPKYNRNPRFIANAETVGTLLKYTSELPHNLKLNDRVIIRNIEDSTEATLRQFNRGFNGSFDVVQIDDELTFYVNYVDIAGLQHNPGTFSNDTSIRKISELPTFEKNDIKSNLYIYRNDVISEFIPGEKDGVYHLYVLNANNSVTERFTDLKFTQLPVDLYPQLDRDNYDDNPLSATTFAKRAPIGDVLTNDLKKSITRESCDLLLKEFGVGIPISGVTYTSTEAVLTFTYNHGLGGVLGGTLSNGGGHTATEKVYYNVKLYSDTTKNIWYGATGRVSVDASGDVTDIKIITPGSGYKALNGSNNKLYPDNTIIGGSIGNTFLTWGLSNLRSNIGDVVQLTGDGKTADGYYRISNLTNKSITINRTNGDPIPTINQYVFLTGPSVPITSTSYQNVITTINGDTQVTVGVIEFTTASAHGLSPGSKFTAISSANVNAGSYIVKDVTSPTVFTVQTANNVPFSVNGGYILKHGLSSNEGISDVRTESYSARTVPFFGDEVFTLSANYSAGSNSAISFTCVTGATDVSDRLKLGDYLQINDEILRVTGEVTNTSAVVSRGYLGTIQGTHESGTLFKKIEVIPVEFRRPSICRASAHTFEYLGYGPGNYSTALPQVQVKTLSEREDFLVQAQERSGGAVIYTGMNSRGDTFTGNTKVSAASGETVSYDIPKPTITGQDPSKLSVAFDEVTVRERIIVEGGASGFVLSQFDGPVTLTKNLRVKGKSYFNNQVRVTFYSDASSPTTGSLVVKGGIGVGGDSYFGGDINVTGNVLLTDNSVLGFGTDVNHRLKIYSDTANDIHYITTNSTTRIVKLQTNNRFTVGTTTDDRLLITANANPSTDGNAAGQVELYYDNGSVSSLKLETTNTGVNITGVGTFTQGLSLPEEKKFTLGNRSSTSVDKSEIYYNSNNLYIDNLNDSDGGDIYIRNVDANAAATDRFIYINAIDDHTSIECKSNEYVKLYYNGLERLVTNNNDVTINADLLPYNDNTYDLGSSSFRWNSAYIGDLQLSSGSISHRTGAKVSISKLSSNSEFEATGTVTLGSSGNNVLINSDLNVKGDITAFYSSDQRLKTNITAIDDPLAKVLSLGGYTFDWIHSENTAREGTETGVIAQEVESLGLPGLVTTRGNGYLAVNYEKLVPLLIEAIKELSVKVENLEQNLSDK